MAKKNVNIKSPENILVAGYPSFALYEGPKYSNFEQNINNWAKLLISESKQYVEDLQKIIIISGDNEELKINDTNGIEVVRFFYKKDLKKFESICKNNKIFFIDKFINTKVSEYLRGMSIVKGIYTRNYNLNLPNAGYISEIPDLSDFYKICHLQEQLITYFDFKNIADPIGSVSTKEKFNGILKSVQPNLFDDLQDPMAWVMLNGEDSVTLEKFINYSVVDKKLQFYTDFADGSIEILANREIYLLFNFDSLDIMKQNLILDKILEIDPKKQKIILAGNIEKMIPTVKNLFSDHVYSIDGLILKNVTWFFYFLLLEQNLIDEATYNSSMQIIKSNLFHVLLKEVQSFSQLKQLLKIINELPDGHFLFQKSFLYDYLQYIKAITNVKIDKVITDTRFDELLVYGRQVIFEDDYSKESQMNKIATCSEYFHQLLLNDKNFNLLIEGLLYYFKNNDGFLLLSNNPNKLNQFAPYRIIYKENYWDIQYGDDLIYYLKDSTGIKIVSFLLMLPEGEYRSTQVMHIAIGKVGKEDAQKKSSLMEKTCKDNIIRSKDLLLGEIKDYEKIHYKNRPEKLFSKYLEEKIIVSEAKGKYIVKINKCESDYKWNIILPEDIQERIKAFYS